MKYVKILFVLLTVALVTACQTGEKKTVDTTGKSIISVDPDEAQVFISIETLEDTADESRTKNRDITDDVINSLTQIVSLEDIETESFNIYEQFEYSQSGRKSIGFRTTHSLKITTKNFDEVGEIIDASVSVGTTRISRINFDISEERRNEVKRQALEEASKDARLRAEALASGIGARLGDVVSISDTAFDYQPYPFFDIAREEGAIDEMAATEILPQELEVRASVKVVFELK